MPRRSQAFLTQGGEAWPGPSVGDMLQVQGCIVVQCLVNSSWQGRWLLKMCPIELSSVSSSSMPWLFNTFFVLSVSHCLSWPCTLLHTLLDSKSLIFWWPSSLTLDWPNPVQMDLLKWESSTMWCASIQGSFPAPNPRFHSMVLC